MKKLFIIVPSFNLTGPVRGAVALANYLSLYRSVTLVSLKKGQNIGKIVSSNVTMCASEGGFFKGFLCVKNLIKGYPSVCLISFCFSADLACLFLKKDRVSWIASVRGNLFKNYTHDYGFLGNIIAFVHLKFLKFSDHVVVMSKSMFEQVNNITKCKIALIRNFVDEAPLEVIKKKNLFRQSNRFVFVGSLSSRKQPLALLAAAARLRSQGVTFHIDIIGDGPLYNKVIKKIDELSLWDYVIVHGHLSNPFDLVVAADVLVLPSLSEGASRAVLEALHLGVPVVLRQVDGNDEIIQENVNGALFKDSEELPKVMLKALNLRKNLLPYESLLPDTARQSFCSIQYMRLLEDIK